MAIDRPVRLYAADVARNYASAAGAIERATQEEITWVAMEVGEHLAERGIAGEWNGIDGVSLALFVLTGELGDRIPFLNHLGRMLVWLTEELLVPYDDALRIMNDLHRTFGVCRMTQRLLDKPLLRLKNLDMPAIRRRREAEKKYFLIPQIITDPPQWETHPEPPACEPEQRALEDLTLIATTPVDPSTSDAAALTVIDGPMCEREPEREQTTTPAMECPPIALCARDQGGDPPPEAA